MAEFHHPADAAGYDLFDTVMALLLGGLPASPAPMVGKMRKPCDAVARETADPAPSDFGVDCFVFR